MLYCVSSASAGLGYRGPVSVGSMPITPPAMSVGTSGPPTAPSTSISDKSARPSGSVEEVLNTSCEPTSKLDRAGTSLSSKTTGAATMDVGAISSCSGGCCTTAAGSTETGLPTSTWVYDGASRVFCSVSWIRLTVSRRSPAMLADRLATSTSWLVI